MNKAGFRIMKKWNVSVAHLDPKTRSWVLVVGAIGLFLGYGTFSPHDASRYGGSEGLFGGLLAGWAVVTIGLVVRMMLRMRGRLWIEDDTLVVEAAGASKRYRLEGACVAYGRLVHQRSRNGTLCHLTTIDGRVRIFGDLHSLRHPALYSMGERWLYDVLMSRKDFAKLLDTIERSPSLRFATVDEEMLARIAAERRGVFRFELGRKPVYIGNMGFVMTVVMITITVVPMLLKIQTTPIVWIIIVMGLYAAVLAILFGIGSMFQRRTYAMTIDADALVMSDAKTGEELHRVPRGRLQLERLRLIGDHRNGDAVRLSGPSMPSFTIGCDMGGGGVGRESVHSVTYGLGITDWDRLRRALGF